MASSYADKLTTHVHTAGTLLPFIRYKNMLQAARVCAITIAIIQINDEQIWISPILSVWILCGAVRAYSHMPHAYLWVYCRMRYIQAFCTLYTILYAMPCHAIYLVIYLSIHLYLLYYLSIYFCICCSYTMPCTIIPRNEICFYFRFKLNFFLAGRQAHRFCPPLHSMAFIFVYCHFNIIT